LRLAPRAPRPACPTLGTPDTARCTSASANEEQRMLPTAKPFVELVHALNMFI
jgi:hypothetical protein